MKPKEGKANDGVSFLPSAPSWVRTDTAEPDSSHRCMRKGWKATDTSCNKGNYDQTLKKNSQLSNNKWSHDGEGPSKATNLHPSLEKAPSNLTQFEWWEGTAWTFWSGRSQHGQQPAAGRGRRCNQSLGTSPELIRERWTLLLWKPCFCGICSRASLELANARGLWIFISVLSNLLPQAASLGAPVLINIISLP